MSRMLWPAPVMNAQSVNTHTPERSILALPYPTLLYLLYVSTQLYSTHYSLQYYNIIISSTFLPSFFTPCTVSSLFLLLWWWRLSFSFFLSFFLVWSMDHGLWMCCVARSFSTFIHITQSHRRSEHLSAKCNRQLPSL